MAIAHSTERFWLVKMVKGLQGVAALWVWGIGLYFNTYLNQYIVLLLLLMTVLTLLLFWFDKRRASQPNANRISERTLLLWGALSLNIGIYIGRAWFKHKTVSLGFNLKLLLSQLLLAGVAGLLLYYKQI
ncbi:DUF1294 domain-containing protein [Pseudoalteromonas fenneropenaei]|uniref:DUF1294 domain-containing protein n=1 Tax=Pseudoalteromonas fenneropenaei TaxID=1737459 RepID=A0ABV7CJN7_9GAMM